ncbi:hypothetical protein M2418_000902 [Rhizobium sp. BIGb0125]|nr:hypothetical protein [Rhizobium sp. BIGb0125]
MDSFLVDGQRKVDLDPHLLWLQGIIC